LSLIKEEKVVPARASDNRSDFAGDEQSILHEVSAALQSIRMGSIVLTIHEGRLVEITKTVRLRFSFK
jgi:hypothetical protein